jgi:hypothetical protein
MSQQLTVKITKSNRDDKKYQAKFYDTDENIVKIVHFGARGYNDYTKHKDEQRKQSYLSRHRKRENWDDFMTAAALSRWILWNKPTLQASINDYVKKFNLKLKK